MMTRRRFIQAIAPCISLLSVGNVMGKTQNNLHALKSDKNVYMYNGWVIRADDLIGEEK